MPTFSTGARIGKQPSCHISQTQGVIEFAMEQQTAVGTDRRASEHELDGAVEPEPQRAGFLFPVASATKSQLRRD